MPLAGLILLNPIDIERMALLDTDVPILTSKDKVKAVHFSCVCGEYVWYQVLSKIDVLPERGGIQVELLFALLDCDDSTSSYGQ